MAYDLTILEEGCQELGITLDEVQKKQFTDFYEYLVEKNKVMNLTGITEFQEVLVKHFLDSVPVNFWFLLQPVNCFRQSVFRSRRKAMMS